MDARDLFKRFGYAVCSRFGPKGWELFLPEFKEQQTREYIYDSVEEVYKSKSDDYMVNLADDSGFQARFNIPSQISNEPTPCVITNLRFQLQGAFKTRSAAAAVVGRASVASSAPPQLDDLSTLNTTEDLDDTLMEVNSLSDAEEDKTVDKKMDTEPKPSSPVPDPKPSPPAPEPPNSIPLKSHSVMWNDICR